MSPRDLAEEKLTFPDHWEREAGQAEAGQGRGEQWQHQGPGPSRGDIVRGCHSGCRQGVWAEAREGEHPLTPNPHPLSPGSYFYTLDWHEAQNERFLLQLPDVQPLSSGIYSATYLEASPLGSAFFRLIVRGQRLWVQRGWDPSDISPWGTRGSPGLAQSLALCSSRL